MSSRVYKLKTYKEVITNPIYYKQLKEAIEKKIQNLENHLTWEYDYLLTNRKTVKSK